MKRLVLVLMILMMVGCGYGNLDYVKDGASERWEQVGLSVIGYDGYEWQFVLPFTTYGGAAVWYKLRKTPDNGILYEGALQRWGNEIHIYNVKAIDAIKP